MNHDSVAENYKSALPWHLYKGPNKCQAKKVFEDFIIKLNDAKGTLESEYYSVNENITIKIDDIFINSTAKNINSSILNKISEFKRNLVNGDTFIKFTSYPSSGLVAIIDLESSNNLKEIHIKNYARFCKSRSNFYKYIKTVGATVVDSVYNGSEDILNIKLDGVTISTTPIQFRFQISKSILRFKRKVINNGDKFICFSGKTKRNVLIATLQLNGGEVKDIDLCNYDAFCKSRTQFKKIIDEIDGEIIGSYKGVEDMVKIKIDDVIVEQLATTIKNDTYYSIKRFKDTCIKNGDTFVRFASVSSRNTLCAQIVPFDSVNNEHIEINIGGYSNFANSRKEFYNSVNSIGGTVLGMYKGNMDYATIKIDDVILSTVTPDSFKLQIKSTIVNFKRQLDKNGDKFVKFVGKTATSLIAKVLLEGTEEFEITINTYNNFCQGRNRFYKFKSDVKNRFNIYGIYKGSTNRLKAECHIDGYEFEFLPIRLHQGINCLRCSESKGEYRISEWLDKHNIEYEKEKTFKDLRDKSLLRYDFYILYKNHKICIEYDGEQHFMRVNFTGKLSDEELSKKLKDVQYKDNLKSKYCKDNDILLLRIPYWQYGEIHSILNQFFINLQSSIALCS